MWAALYLSTLTLDKSLLGQLVPWTIAPWTIVATPQFWLKFKGRLLGISITDSKCLGDNCLGHICPVILIANYWSLSSRSLVTSQIKIWLLIMALERDFLPPPLKSEHIELGLICCRDLFSGPVGFGPNRPRLGDPTWVIPGGFAPSIGALWAPDSPAT